MSKPITMNIPQLFTASKEGFIYFRNVVTEEISSYPIENEANDVPEGRYDVFVTVRDAKNIYLGRISVNGNGAGDLATLLSGEMQVVDVTAVSKTLALQDAFTIQVLNAGGTAQTVTLPLDATADFSIGNAIFYEYHGTGGLTFVGESGVTINGTAEAGGNESAITVNTQYSSGYIRKHANNTFILMGSS